MFDDNTIHLPPTISNKAVAKAAAEYADLRVQLDSEHRRLSELEQARHQAEEADRVAFAAAIRKGSADPGTSKIEEADRAIADSTRRIEALTLAVADSRRALVATVEAQRQAWQETLDAKVAEAAAQFSGAVEAVATAHDTLAEALMVSGWLRAFPTSRLKPAARTSRVEALISPNGSASSWVDVVAALRDHAASAAAQPEVPKIAASV